MTDALTQSQPGWSRQRVLIAGAVAIALLWLLFRLLFGNLIEPGLLPEKAIHVPERNLGRSSLVSQTATHGETPCSSWTRRNKRPQPTTD